MTPRTQPTILDLTPFNGQRPAELHLTAEEDREGYYTGRHIMSWFDPEQQRKFYKTFDSWAEACAYLVVNIANEF